MLPLAEFPNGIAQRPGVTRLEPGEERTYDDDDSRHSRRYIVVLKQTLEHDPSPSHEHQSLGATQWG